METKSTSRTMRGLHLVLVAVSLSVATTGVSAMGPVVDKETGITYRAPHKLPNEYYHLRKAREAAEFARLEAVSPGDAEAAGSLSPRRDPRFNALKGNFYRHK